MQVPEAVQFPEVVQVEQVVLPQSRNLTEGPDNAAALRAHVSDHRHAAAAAHAPSCRLLYPGQGQRRRGPTQTPPGHGNSKTKIKMPALVFPQLLLCLRVFPPEKKDGLVGPPPAAIKALLLN